MMRNVNIFWILDEQNLMPQHKSNHWCLWCVREASRPATSSGSAGGAEARGVCVARSNVPGFGYLQCFFDFGLIFLKDCCTTL